ncbi:MAG: hypothetical protein AVDCRST_MAG30-3522, partial [uncultured Solirubrobacteraceae bacterium]
ARPRSGPPRCPRSDRVRRRRALHRRPVPAGVLGRRGGDRHLGRHRSPRPPRRGDDEGLDQPRRRHPHVPARDRGLRACGTSHRGPVRARVLRRIGAHGVLHRTRRGASAAHGRHAVRHPAAL